MPRNSSGTYTLPEAAFVPSTPISSAAVNSNNDDLADAMTDSLSRTGDGGMQAVLGLHIDGLNYVADTDTGLRRTAANTQALFSNGSNVLTVSPGAVAITGTLASSGAVTVQAGGITVTAGGVTVTAGGLTVTSGGITAPTGNFAAPTYSFASDPDSGFYRIGPNNIGAAVNGAKVLDISTAGLAITGTLSATGGIIATNAASQADQEAGSSTTTFVSPGRQQFHLSAAKAWASIGSNGTIQTSYNFTSTTHPGTGSYTATLTTPMSSAVYVVVGNTLGPGTLYVTALASGTVTYTTTVIPGGAAADLAHFLIVFGDQ